MGNQNFLGLLMLGLMPMQGSHVAAKDAAWTGMMVKSLASERKTKTLLDLSAIVDFWGPTHARACMIFHFVSGSWAT